MKINKSLTFWFMILFTPLVSSEKDNSGLSLAPGEFSVLKIDSFHTEVRLSSSPETESFIREEGFDSLTFKKRLSGLCYRKLFLCDDRIGAFRFEPVDSFTISPGIYKSPEYLKYLKACKPDKITDLRYLGKIAGKNLYFLNVFPICGNPVDSSLKIYSRFRLLSSVPTQDILCHSSFFSIPWPDVCQSPPVRYLIIAPEIYENALQPFIQWKNRCGFEVHFTRLSEIGEDAEEIHNYIRTCYYAEDTPLRYLLLVGDTDGSFSFPTFYVYNPVHHGNDPMDHPYSLVCGEDFLPDLFVGRLSVDSPGELSAVVNKIIQYEREPYIGDQDWLRHALMICDYSHGYWTAPSTRETKRWVRRLLLSHGFTQVDSAYYGSGQMNTGLILGPINNGVGFVNYRGASTASGWYPGFYVNHVDQLQNGPMTPVVTSIVCSAGNFSNTVDPCLGEAFLRAGTVSTPAGAVSFIGTGGTTSTRWNNCLDSYLYWGIFEENIHSLGEALLYAKMGLFPNFPNNIGDGGISPNTVEFYFHMFFILGDPSLQIRTHFPRFIQADFPDSLSLNQDFVQVHVFDENGMDVENAVVTLYCSPDIHLVCKTDVTGLAGFTVHPADTGEIFLTVTGDNLFPLCSSIQVSPSGFPILLKSAYMRSQTSDSTEILPGNAIELVLTFKNASAEELIDSLQISLTDTSGVVIINDNTSIVRNIAPLDSFSVAFSGILSADAPMNFVMSIPVIVNIGGQTDSIRTVITISNPDLEILDFDKPSLQAGTVRNLFPIIKNRGQAISDSLHFYLRCHHPKVVILDSVSSIPPLSPATQLKISSDPFTVLLSPYAQEGDSASFEVFGDDSVFHGVVSLPFFTENSLTGPDAYGYYAIDSGDRNHAAKPDFRWREISPRAGGNGTILELTDRQSSGSTDPDPQGDSGSIPLPFTFSFYGKEYDSLTICSNGWIAAGSTYRNDFRNWNIPHPMNPPNLIAPLWDDLYMGSGDVSFYYSSGEGIFIVEWHEINTNSNNDLQTFQVIIRDPQIYPTVSGDSQIIFQYLTVENRDATTNYATVGIESTNHSCGLTYSYAGEYSPGAHPLQDSLSILFTTDTSVIYNYFSSEKNQPVNFKLFSPYPNPFNSSVIFRFSLNSQGKTSLIVYDLLGRETEKLLTEYLTPGEYQIRWEPKTVNSGVYFCQLRQGKLTQTVKIMYLK